MFLFIFLIARISFGNQDDLPNPETKKGIKRKAL